MATIYRESDADLNLLRGKTVGVIGYGSLGRPLANNLRDSGIRVLVGAPQDESRDHASEDGFEPQDIEVVVPRCHILMLLVPDVALPEVYLELVSPHLRRGHMLVVASGYNIAFGFVEPPPFVDVGMIAPRTIGEAVRARYLAGSGFFSFIGVGQDATGFTLETLLALARAMGSLRAGAIEMSPEKEAQLDLFVQQALLPAFHHLMTTAAGVLLEMDFPPEAVLMDLIISGELTDVLSRASQRGLLHALRLMSLTGQYGTFSRLHRFRELKLEGLMEATMEEIRNGDFATEWSREYENGYPRLNSLLEAQEKLALWILEQDTLQRLR